MKLCLSVFCVLMLGCISARAQGPYPGPPPGPPFQLVKAYLDLTDAQISQIKLNLSDYRQLVAQRQQRMFQVQLEIQVETARSPLDPAALGIRYAEIETICRNVQDESIAALNRNLAALTDAQKAKMKLLNDAYRLLPIINDAQNAGLFTPAVQYSSVATPWFDTSSFVSSRMLTLSGCQQSGVFGFIISPPAFGQ